MTDGMTLKGLLSKPECSFALSDLEGGDGSEFVATS
jgi:hypothetical protein